MPRIVVAGSVPQTFKDKLAARIAEDVAKIDRMPKCPRCSQPFEKWRHSLVDGAPICEPCWKRSNPIPMIDEASP